MPPAFLECVIVLKFNHDPLRAHTNCHCICCKCLKKVDGILIGRACMQYKSLGRMTIFTIAALPNHENLLSAIS